MPPYDPSRIGSRAKPEPADLTALDEALLERCGEPPLDPIGNAEWGSNVAAAWTCIANRNRSMPLQERMGLVMDGLDRIARSTPQATKAKRIGELQRKAGVKTTPTTDGARVLPIDRSGSLRAGGRVQRREAIPLPVADVPPKTDG